MSRYRVIETTEKCKNCKKKLECRTHTEITQKHMNQPFYYEKWYMCLNRDCKTTMISWEDDRVLTPKGEREKRAKEELEQNKQHFFNI